MKARVSVGLVRGFRREQSQGEDGGGPEDDTAVQGRSKLGLPLQEGTVVEAELASREFNPEMADILKVLQHLRWGVVGDLRRHRGGRMRRRRGPPAGDSSRRGCEDMAKSLQRFDDASKENTCEVRDDSPAPIPAHTHTHTWGRGRVVGDNGVDAYKDGLHESREGMEAAAYRAAPSQSFDVANQVEYDEEHGVRQPIEVVDPLPFQHLRNRRIPEPIRRIRGGGDSEGSDRTGSKDLEHGKGWKIDRSQGYQTKKEAITIDRDRSEERIRSRIGALSRKGKPAAKARSRGGAGEEKRECVN